MATRTRTGSKTPVVYNSKSDHARALFRAGTSIAEVTRIVPGMGYAFAYGIAKRLAASDSGFDIRTVAGERKTRQVTVDRETGIVTVATATGPVEVHPDGTVKRTK